MIFDIAVIGGGVVGCAIFNRLVEAGQKVVLLEAESDVATGASKANSGLVHAGFDCEPKTLKAKFNVEGNAMFTSLTQRLGIPFKRIGALVVGDNEAAVYKLYQRGIENKVPGLKILDRKELIKLNSHFTANIKCALYAKTAGIVSPYMLTVALAEEAVINGGEAMLNFKVDKVLFSKGVFTIYSGDKKVLARRVVNAAGFGYNAVAKLLKTETYETKFVRGEYFLLDKNAYSFASQSIFPLPSEKGKGVLVTPTIDGNLIVGPTAIDGDTSTPTTEEGLNKIVESVKLMMTDVPFNETIREFAGVRTVCGKDFIVEVSKKNDKVINIAGICSPGLSSAPAIAKFVVEKLLNLKNKIELKKRKQIIDFSACSLAEKKKLIKQDSAYGEIVCKCELVTKKEIIDAISSPLKPKTFDALKRRVRVGMGRCQSGFCLLRTMEILASEQDNDITDIEKEYAGSKFAPYTINQTGENIEISSRDFKEEPVRNTKKANKETVKTINKRAVKK